MEQEEKLVVFNKYANAIDANIVKGALESSGIAAGVIADSTANAMWMAPVMVIVFRRDLEDAIRAIYGSEMSYEDYSEEMNVFEFENLQACSKVFSELALKIHPVLGGKQFRDLYAEARDAFDNRDLKTLNRIKDSL